MISDDLPLTDPANGGKIYPASLASVSFGLGSQPVYGIGAPATMTPSPPLSLNWMQAAAGAVSFAAGTDWASYSLLAAAPLMTYQTPSPTVLLPGGQGAKQIIRLEGSLNIGNLPVYLRFVFVSRLKQIPFFTVPAGLPFVPQVISLSLYQIDPSVDIVVVSGTQSYEEDQDYTLDFSNGNRNLTCLASLAGVSLTIFCNEFYPAYQCSINGTDWSPPLFLDGLQPFPDPLNTYFPLALETGADGSTWYPLSDELGYPLGLFFQPAGLITQEYLIRIAGAGTNLPAYGATAVLEIDLAKPDYLNGVHLEPYTNLPMRLQQISGEGLGLDSNQVLWTGDLTLDRPLTVRFANSDGTNPYLNKLFLTLYQENYTLVESVTSSPAELRQATLAQFQYFIPYAKSAIYQAPPSRLTGAEYDFGLKNIQAERWDWDGPGVFVTGPYLLLGAPAILRLDAVVYQAIDCYPVITFFGTTGAVLVSMMATAPLSFIDSGSFTLSIADYCLAAWPPGTVWPTGIASATVYLKWIYRDSLSVLTRYCLQVL